MPCYLDLHKTGELARRSEMARERMSLCRLCPRACGVWRDAGERGFCRTGALARLASASPHFGEEPPLSGTGGAGAVFFGGCVMACRFCQNHAISQTGEGDEVSAGELAAVFLNLQEQGAENLDLVSPTHVVPQILEALGLAAEQGLRLPVVFNTGGFDSVETLQLLDGVVDIYLPDSKYADDEAAQRCSALKGYVKANRAALREMFRQVGPLRLDDRGVATRGMLVRHLVLPNNLAGTGRVMRFLAEKVSPEVHVSLMAQYSPCHRAAEDPALARAITAKEYEAALDAFDASGLETGFAQDFESVSHGLPDFGKDEPFEW